MKEDSKDALGNRMKQYESVPAIHLMRRTPVIVRCDGRAFHSFCKRFPKPYSSVLNDTLNEVMRYACSKIQNVQFAERHSDEISFVLTDYETIHTEAFFDYNVQKVVSTVATIVSTKFCQELLKLPSLSINEDWPTFDCRCFNLPVHEVANYFWWRMLDSKRNSIAMWAQSKFSHKELHGVNSKGMEDMLFKVHGIAWGDLPQGQKMGYCCHKVKKDSIIDKGPMEGQSVSRTVWEVNPSESTRRDVETKLYFYTNVFDIDKKEE
jgi:tRNA(His) 5'-end guanylyltransferase